MTKSAAPGGSAKAGQSAAAKQAQPESEESSIQIKKFLNLLRTASNEALMGLIVDGLSSELSTKPQKVQYVMDFVTKELPKCEQDFTRLKASEKMIPLFY